MFVPPKAEFCICNDAIKDYFPDFNGQQIIRESEEERTVFAQFRTFIILPGAGER